MNLLSNASGYALAFQAADITSEKMRIAIREWYDLYFGSDPDENADPCQRIAYLVVNKLTKTVFSEYEATTDNAFAKGLLYALGDCAKTAMQMALIGGECALKPIPTAGGFRFAVVPRHNILVFARDPQGMMTDIGTAEVTTAGNCYYTLLERRTVDGKGFLTIRYQLFKSYAKENLGQAVPLNSLSQYKQLQEEYTFPRPVGTIGLIGIKTPMVNCVDGSSDGVSVYAPAVGLIRNIDHNEQLLKEEFDRGQSRIVVSADMLKTDKSGGKVLKDHLFVGLDEDPDTLGFNIFNPTLREASFLALKQELLRNVESLIGLKRGLLSEVEAAQRTATEITSSAGDYNLTVIDFQKMWEKTVRDALDLCSVLGELYQVPNACNVPEEAVSITWGNGILYDEAEVYKELKEQVSMGLIQPERLLGWYYNMPCDTPDERAAIRERYMPAELEEEDGDE